MENENRIESVCFVIVCVCVLFLAGCGHSGNFTASGKVLQIGTPEFGMTYVNGLMTVTGSRENTESVVEFNDDDGITGGPTADLKSIRTIRYKTGVQLNGYAVDLAKRCPDAAIEYVKLMPELNLPANWDVKETVVKKQAGEKSTSDNYIEYLKEKLKSIAGGKSDGKAVFSKDGEYNKLWEDKTIEKQAALTAELLAKCDDVTEIQEEGELIKTTLIHFTGRLAQLKAAGATESKRICLDRATIKDGNVSFLRYRLTDLKTGETSDEVCPNCYGLETEDN